MSRVVLTINRVFFLWQSSFPCPGCPGAHGGDDARAVLPGHADREASARHAGGQRGLRQDRAHAGQAHLTLRRLHDRQRALQLLHNLAHVAGTFYRLVRSVCF